MTPRWSCQSQASIKKTRLLIEKKKNFTKVNTNYRYSGKTQPFLSFNPVLIKKISSLNPA